MLSGFFCYLTVWITGDDSDAAGSPKAMLFQAKQRL